MAPVSPRTGAARRRRGLEARSRIGGRRGADDTLRRATDRRRTAGSGRRVRTVSFGCQFPVYVTFQITLDFGVWKNGDGIEKSTYSSP